MTKTSPDITEEDNTAYCGDGFLGKNSGEKGIQLAIAADLLKHVKLKNDKPVTFYDYGCADGWFSEAILKQRIIHPDSKGILFDTSPDQYAYAKKLAAKNENLFASNNIAETRHTQPNMQQVDIVFLNMVDICQSTELGLLRLFRQASICLKPNGALIVTTQNPMAPSDKYTFFKKEKVYPKDMDNYQFKTHIDGVPFPIYDKHRPLHFTLKHMYRERMKPSIISTADDLGSIKTCNLNSVFSKSTLDEIGHGKFWTPIQDCSTPNKFHMFQTNIHGKELATAKPDYPLSIDPKAPYLGIAAINE